MSGSPSHAFVVPAYGRSPFLAECLESLSRQSLKSEIVVSTSTPFEGLSQLAAEYGARLVVHDTDPGRTGIGADWNRAIASVQTDWVTLAHQDDVYDQAFASRTMAAAQDRVTLVFTGYGEIANGRVRRWTSMLLIKRVLVELAFLGRNSISARAAKLRLLRFGCAIPCPSVTLARHAIGRVGFSESLAVNLDWKAWIQLAISEGDFAVVRRELMLHRIHRASETSAAVVSGVRSHEDREMFNLLWPAPLAALLSRLYESSYEKGGGDVSTVD